MNKVDSKHQYANFVELHPHATIFHQPWWLDIVADGRNWEVELYEKGGKINAVMPYYLKKTMGLNLCTMPPFTQSLGPLFIKQNDHFHTQSTLEKRATEHLIQSLPPHDIFTQSFHVHYKNWLPFFWNNFTQTTAYTYILDLSHEFDVLFQNIKSNTRSCIRNGEKYLCVSEKQDIQILIDMYIKTYRRKNKPIPYSIDLIKTIYDETQNRQCSKLLVVTDENDTPLSSALIVWHNDTAIYLIGGLNNSVKDNNAQSFLLWHAICHAKNIGCSFFNFEGSMDEKIERFFKSFGATQTPYFQIKQCKTWLGKLATAIKNITL